MYSPELFTPRLSADSVDGHLPYNKYINYILILTPIMSYKILSDNSQATNFFPCDEPLGPPGKLATLLGPASLTALLR